MEMTTNMCCVNQLIPCHPKKEKDKESNGQRLVVAEKKTDDMLQFQLEMSMKN